MNSTRVNKGLEKEIRFFGLKYTYATNYFAAVTFTWLFLFSILELNVKTIILFILPIVVYHQYYRKVDKRNQKENIQKKRANSKKPTKFKRNFTPISENEKLFTK